MGFDALYGLEVTDCSDELVRGRVRVRDDLKQSAGLVHGGLYSAIAEALAAMGAAGRAHIAARYTLDHMGLDLAAMTHATQSTVELLIKQDARQEGELGMVRERVARIEHQVVQALFRFRQGQAV